MWLGYIEGFREQNTQIKSTIEKSYFSKFKFAHKEGLLKIIHILWVGKETGRDKECMR